MATPFWLDWQFWLTVLLSVVFSILLCFLLFFAYVFRARHNQFGFNHRKSTLTLASVGFASLYLLNRIYAVWLVYFGVFAIEDGGRVSRGDRIMLLTYEVLNSLPVFGMGLSISARVWLIFYDVNLAIRSGDEQWMDLISKWNIDMDNLHTLSASQRASSLIGKLIALPQFIKKTSSNRSVSRKKNLSPRSADRKSPRKGHSMGNSLGSMVSTLKRINETTELNNESLPSESIGTDLSSPTVEVTSAGGDPLKNLDSEEEEEEKEEDKPETERDQRNDESDLKVVVDPVDDKKQEQEKSEELTTSEPRSTEVMKNGSVPPMIRKQSSFASEAYSKSKNDWFFSHKQSWGNMYWVLYRVVVPMLLLFMILVIVLSALELYTLIPLVYAVWLLCCAVYGFTLYSFFPQFHDHLLLYSELALISWFSAAVGAVVMVFSVLLLTSTVKEGQFLFSTVRSTFNVVCFFTVHAFQTLWVIHQFQQNSAHLNNPDIYSGNSLHKAPSLHGGSNQGFDNNSRRMTDLYNGETSLRVITEIQQKNTVCYYFLCCVDLTVDKIHHTGQRIGEVRRTMSMRKESTTESNDLSGILGRQSTADIGGAASPISGDGRRSSARKSHRSSMDRLLRRVLADETGFRLFMAHLFREFSYENLLAVIEFVQFSKQMMVEEGLLDAIKHQTVFPLTVQDIMTYAKLNEDDGDDGLALVSAGQIIGTPTLTLTSDRDHRQYKGSKKLNVNSLVQSLVSFPHYVECTRSSIVFDKRMIKEEKFLALFDKYVSHSSDLAINIDFRTRKPLTLLASEIRKWNNERHHLNADDNRSEASDDDDDFDLDSVFDLGSEVNHSTFDGCVKQLMILMRDSFSRFQRTQVYSKLRAENPQLFNIV